MIELEQARELLHAAVETRGRDFVYNPNGYGTCKYTPLTERDEPDPDYPARKTGCVVGVALDLAGETRHHGSPLSVIGLQDTIGDFMTKQAARYLRVAQEEQDSGASWGQAYDAAESALQRISYS